MQISGARALVAGGASGLGAATARRLHAAGANVTIADLDEVRGAALAAELGQDSASFVACDVTEPSQVEAAVKAAVGSKAQHGLRIAVCCAGIGWAERLVGAKGAHDLAAFARVIEVNLIGTFSVLRHAAAAMRERTEVDPDGERGVCVLTTSIAYADGQIGQVAYAAAKGGVASLVLPAARDLASAGVRVMAVAPGLFDTPLLAGLPAPAREALGASVPHPARLGLPEEYAALVAHVVENPMLNGEIIRLDGALRMAPR